MKTLPARLLLGILGAVALGIAMGADLKPTAPAKVDLTGLWRINPDLSDDPHEAVARKRRDASGDAPRGGPAGGGRGGSQGGVVIDAGDIFDGVFGGSVGGSVGGRRGGGGGTSDRPAGDPEPATMRMPLDAFLATLEEFEIAQQPDALTISTLEQSDTCRPAEPGEAPLPGGDKGERRCGWRGSAWVTEVTAPNGVTRSNRYELRKGGRELVMISEVKGGKTPLSGLRIRRVYDRVVLN
jgi:hypothetical protein